MERNIGNAFLCLSKNCTHRTALVQDIDEIEQHPQHVLVKIQNLKNQLNDRYNPLNKFQQFNREKILIDIDAKIQEIISFTNVLIIQFEQEMKRIANNTIELFDNQNYLINAVINLQAQIIGENSKAISKLFNLDQKEIELQLNQAIKMKIVANEQRDQLKEQMIKLFQSINFKNYEQFNQVFEWSQVMKNSKIEIKDKTAFYGNELQIILMEPRIDFNSTQSCRVKFFGGYWFKQSNAGIILGDYNIIKQNNPEFNQNKPGSYILQPTGSVQYEDTILPNKSFKFYKNDLIEIFWDGSRRVFGIKKIETSEKFEMEVQFTENSQLYFGVILHNSNCSLE